MGKITHLVVIRLHYLVVSDDDTYTLTSLSNLASSTSFTTKE
jgi:hypothetical protein